ncbi:MAG: prepilin-type N-terminal cleavage/methylation domain-containing protein [Candidatus Omnitrophica bacterium]|nr:prepilin-type N-terminal cleavage/methylation domain-containing protein [Candidatus Omnitrophota bacterium]
MKKKGFTLIEIIIVLVILGILAAIAFSSYYSWVKRSKAAEAAATLKSYADTIEGIFFKNIIINNGDFSSAYTQANNLPIPTSPNFTYFYGGSDISPNPPYTYDYLITATIRPTDGQFGTITFPKVCTDGQNQTAFGNSTIFLCRTMDGTRFLIGSGVFNGVF